MGRFLIIYLVIGLLVAGAVFSLSPKWGGILTGGVLGFLIIQAVYQKRSRS